jgi:Nucleoside-diphosphate-sugar epimerases
MDGENYMFKADLGSAGKIPCGAYFITGITGFIGSLLVKSILQTSEYMSGGIEIYGLTRDINKASKMYNGYDCNHLHFVVNDLNSLNPERLTAEDEFYIKDIDYIIHCAANTKSSDMLAQPVETAEGIVAGTGKILRLASLYNVQSMVYVSSMEVYGAVPDLGKLTEEDELGSVDILSARSSYPMGKRMAENLCYSYFKEYKVPVKIARLAQTFGVGVLPTESRVFAQFARCAINGENIVLHTKGDSVGNYVESEDAVRALFLLLTEGANGEAYNIANEAATMSIFEMAQLVADTIAEGRIKVFFDIPEDNKYGYAAKTGLRLSSKKIRELGWMPQYGMENMYQRMIKYIMHTSKVIMM